MKNISKKPRKTPKSINDWLAPQEMFDHCCGDCAEALGEDLDGNLYCDFHNEMRHCSQYCDDWKEKKKI